MDEDIKSWVERLESLRKCVLEPEKCTHDRNEKGEVQKFDSASIDMCLGQIISEMEQYLNKKQLFIEMKRMFQDAYNDLMKDIERLKKEFASGDEQPWFQELVLSSVEVGIIFRALQKYKAFLEHFYKDVKPGSPAYMEFDSEIERTKEVIGFVETVLYGRAFLILKRST